MSDTLSFQLRFLEKVGKTQEKLEAALGEIQPEDFENGEFLNLHRRLVTSSMAVNSVNMMNQPLQKVLDER